MRLTTTIALLVFSGGVFAAGFDCSKAATLVEQSICANKQLSELDDALSAGYKKALAGPGNSEAIKKRQKEWIVGERNKCPDTACLKNAYTKRIAELAKVSTPTLEAGNEVTVPEGQQWVIDSFMPYESERGIGTADLYVEGNANVGGKYSLSGKFDISVGPGASGPIVVYGGSKLSVGDSRGTISYKVKKAN